jgi:hypothetical protein
MRNLLVIAAAVEVTLGEGGDEAEVLIALG